MPPLKRVHCRVVLLTFFFGISLTASADTISIATDNQLTNTTPPDSQTQSVVSCLMEQSGIEFNLLQMPWARAKRQLQTGEVDGIYFTTPGEVTDAVNSVPVLLEKWFIYSLPGTDITRPDLRIGTVRDSATEAWVQQHWQHPQLQASSLEQLARLLESGRIDALLADERRMKALLETQHQLVQHFVRYAPKNITFHPEFILSHPRLLNDIDRYIPHCNPDAVILSGDERRQVIAFMYQSLLPHFDQNTLKTAEMQLQNMSPVTADDIEQVEQQWQEEKSTGRYQLIADYLNNPLAEQLRGIKQQYPQIGELLVTEGGGQLLAISDVTTDFFQGDEDKIKGLMNHPLFIDRLRYDFSTRRFQVQISTLIPLSQGHIVLVAGLYPEQLFTHSLTLHPALEQR